MKTLVRTQHDPGDLTAGDTLRIGTRAGPWLIQRELGRGGMGLVYEVVHAQIGKRAALKVMRLGSQQVDTNAHRMQLEAQVVNAIRHPNIVDIFDVGTTADGRAYIVMELLEGRSLDQAEQGLGIREAIEILRQVCAALLAAHAAGVIHRDLKPENIFLADTSSNVPRVVLLDWGIARMVHDDRHHTLEGQLVGTPRYIAPEQARGEVVTSKTDVYSLGVVAYELVLLRPPFDADSTAEVMAMHLLVAPRPPREVWPEIPPPLDRLLEDMLAKAPAARPTVAEVAARLEEIASELDATPQPVAASRTPTSAENSVHPVTEPMRGAVGRRRFVAPLVVLGVVAITGLGVLWIRHGVPPSRGRAAPRTLPVAPPTLPAPPAASVAPAPPPSVPVRELANPVLADCTDPAVLREGVHWYMTCTGGYAGNQFPIYESENLQSWERIGWVFPVGHKPEWASGNYWAPELHRTPAGIAAYFSMRVRGARNAIGVATATAIGGPYADLGAPLTAPREGASDAHVLIDGERRYLYFKSEGRPVTIQVQPLAADGITTDGEATSVLGASEAWEHGNVEAPWVIHEAGYYYLFYTGSRYCDVTYAVGVARATTPLGPFEKLPEPIVVGNADWLAPGHVAVTQGADDERYLVYHAYRASEGAPSCKATFEHNTRRHARIERLVFDHGWPHVGAAIETR